MADVVKAIQAGANVNSVGPKYAYYDPAAPLIECKQIRFFKTFLKILYKVLFKKNKWFMVKTIISISQIN